MPYSYMLNAQMREKLQLQIKDSIIVFDEAHNIDSNCEEIYSFEIEIQQAWRAFFYLERYSKNGGDFSGEESYDIR
jgi:Rad3-related DNA helicase